MWGKKQYLDNFNRLNLTRSIRRLSKLFNMYCLYFMLVFLSDIFANPLPQRLQNLISARNDFIDQTFDIALSVPNSNGPMDNLEDFSLRNTMNLENTIHNADVVIDDANCPSSFTENIDSNSLVKRLNRSCPIPTKLVTPTSPTPEDPSPRDRNQEEQSQHEEIQRKPPLEMEAKNVRCADHPGRSLHVTCGGPEAGLESIGFAIVANCISGSVPTIPSRPPNIFLQTSLVAQYCCERYSPDRTLQKFYAALVCTKLNQIPIRKMFLGDFRIWTEQFQRFPAP